MEERGIRVDDKGMLGQVQVLVEEQLRVKCLELALQFWENEGVHGAVVDIAEQFYAWVKGASGGKTGE